MKRLNKFLESESEITTLLLMLKKSKSGILGILVILGFILTSIFGPYIVPYDPIDVHLDNIFQPPNQEFLFGTDEFGRDVLSRVIYGSRVSLVVSVSVVTIAMTIGVLIGCFTGYYSGPLDLIVMRFVDIITSFPSTVLALGLMAILGRGIDKLILILPLTFWVSYTRIVRSIVLSIRKLDYIEAAKVFGSSNIRIILNHVLPNVFPSCIVIATFQLGTAILTEASLSFLGLGINPPTPSWGNMLTSSRTYILKAPYLAFIPGLAITIVILGFNLLGDALRDALDPRLRL